jgi:hypothetical protein
MRWSGPADWLPQELQARRANLRRGQAGLRQQIERLTEAYLAGVVPLAEYDRRRRDAEARLLTIEGQERELMQDADRHGETARLAAHVEAFCRRVREGLERADFDRKRELLELLIDRVIVTDGAVEIRYVVPTGPDGEREPFWRLRTDHQDDLPGREVARQVPPGAAGPQHVEYAVQQRAHRPPARPATARRAGQERLRDLPLGIGQAGCIGLERASKLDPGGGGPHRQPRGTSDIPRTPRTAVAHLTLDPLGPVPKRALRAPLARSRAVRSGRVAQDGGQGSAAGDAAAAAREHLAAGEEGLAGDRVHDAVPGRILGLADRRLGWRANCRSRTFSPSEPWIGPLGERSLMLACRPRWRRRAACPRRAPGRPGGRA